MDCVFNYKLTITPTLSVVILTFSLQGELILGIMISYRTHSFNHHVIVYSGPYMMIKLEYFEPFNVSHPMKLVNCSC